MIDANEVSEYLTYNSETGILRRAKTTGRTGQHKKGERAGHLAKDGYWTISINGKAYKSHRLAFALMTGRWPKEQLDHINGDKSDNRWINLREATQSQNQWNVGKKRKNTSGYTGVLPCNGKWRACISHNKQRVHIGLFPTAELAHAAYLKKRSELHGNFAKIDDEEMKRLRRLNLLDSGLDVEWQSWPLDMERPELWACGRVTAEAEFFDQIAQWYPDFTVKICQDQPEAVLKGRPLIEVLENYV
jgi:hypothetical protein